MKITVISAGVVLACFAAMYSNEERGLLSLAKTSAEPFDTYSLNKPKTIEAVPLHGASFSYPGIISLLPDQGVKSGDLEPAITAALSASGKGGQSAAIILTQRFIGAKAF